MTTCVVCGKIGYPDIPLCEDHLIEFAVRSFKKLENRIDEETKRFVGIGLSEAEARKQAIKFLLKNL